MIATSTTTTRTKATTTTTKTTRTNITTRTATIKTTGKNGPAGLAPGYHEVGGRKAAPSKNAPDALAGMGVHEGPRGAS